MCDPAVGQEQRHLGAHQHGHGRLQIAIEGNAVSIELEVPGADIVGFEHPPTTPEQKTAFEQAKARLANGFTLFVPPAPAGCALKEARVSTEAEEEGKES